MVMSEKLNERTFNGIGFRQLGAILEQLGR